MSRPDRHGVPSTPVTVAASPRATHAGSVAVDRARRRLVVVGSSVASYHSLRERLGRAGRSAPTVAGVLAAAEPPQEFGWRHLGGFDILDELLSNREMTEVVLCLDGRESSFTETVVQACSARRIPVSIPVPGLGQQPDELSAHRSFFRVVKRSMDVVGAVIGLALAVPILLAAGIAVLVVDGRPIFFRQQRAGLNGRPFRILKFRTMKREADALRRSLRDQNEITGQAAFKMKDDPRVTGLGRWLRKTSIDELPQLWNVLRGEMSLVGPRPHPYDDVAGYEPWHIGRLAAKPGLTGLWQVELRNDADFDRGVRKDLEYIASSSVWLDLSLILKTLPVLLRGTGR